MTHQEVIERLLNIFDVCKWDTDDEDGIAEDIAIEALEKQTPKKLEIHMETIYDDDGVYDIINCFTCPVCGNAVAWFHTYCDNCGQALDWSEMEDGGPRYDD